MESSVDPDYNAALPDVSPAEVRQQGMSPNTAGATAATDVPMRAEDTAMVAGNREQNVEMRAMTVAMAADQSPSTPMWSPMMAGARQGDGSQAQLVDTATQPLGQMNAAQASWSMMSTRRATPVWIQRLGAFFHEMRGQQVMWPPSPMGSPPQRSQVRPAGSPDTDPGLWAQPTLLTQEQQEQLRRMEQRAPLLYGPQGRSERAQEGSSGGSTYEAVQDEVKRQLRGVVSQLEASKREAQGLREEVEQLRAEQHHAAAAAAARNMRPPAGPPTTLGGYLTGQVSSGNAALTALTVSGDAALTAPTVSGDAALRTPTVSGSAALRAPTVSGFAGLSAPTVSGPSAMSTSMAASGVANAVPALTQGVPPMPGINPTGGAPAMTSTMGPAAANQLVPRR